LVEQAGIPKWQDRAKLGQHRLRLGIRLRMAKLSQQEHPEGQLIFVQAGACARTLKFLLRCSSSSKMAATLPHLRVNALRIVSHAMMSFHLLECQYLKSLVCTAYVEHWHMDAARACSRGARL